MAGNALYSQRNMAIDMLRALTMFLMITVNEFWTVTGVPHFLLHSQVTEDFMGLSDFVFPLFLFAMGMSIPYAIENRYRKGYSSVSTAGHILSRSIALMIMGVIMVNSEGGLSEDMPYGRVTYWILELLGFFMVWNAYPVADKPWKKWLFNGLKVLGAAILVFLALTFRSKTGGVFQTRWWGILGLIGWAYLTCATIYFFFRDNLWVLIPVWAIFCFICLLTAPAGPDAGDPLLNLPQPNLFDQIRNLIHFGTGGHNALAMGGMILSVISAKKASIKSWRRMLAAVLAGCLLAVLATFAREVQIISKNLETLPWVLYVSAVGVVLYACLKWLADRNITGWYRIFRPAGSATLTTYMVPHIFLILWVVFNMHTLPWLTGIVGIVKCFLFAFLCIAVSWGLGKLGIKLKV